MFSHIHLKLVTDPSHGLDVAVLRDYEPERADPFVAVTYHSTMPCAKLSRIDLLRM